MLTLKLKYETTSNNLSLIQEYQRQYNICLRFMYNRFKDNENVSKKSIEQINVNNIQLIDCYFKRCAVNNAYDLHKKDGKTKNNKPIIFGGKLNFLKRCKLKISKEEYNKNRLLPLYSMGEANQKGNRKFQIIDENIVVFKPNKKTHCLLNLIGIGNNRIKYIKRLLELQENKKIPISYKLDTNYIYISFDEQQLFDNIYVNNYIKNRTMAIDLNPNYIGWSIVDWKSSSEYEVIKTGIYSIKKINDIDFSLKGKGYSSESKERKYISNKREYETLQISKALVNIAKHYRCEVFSVEELSIWSKDSGKGKRYNKLVNNSWNRNRIINNIRKRCGFIGIQFIEVKANYSSFIGNVLFREEKQPDMVLSSIEIGRRGYEYKMQYIDKEREVINNIIKPKVSDFIDKYAKSLEEFGIEGGITDMVELYYYIKEKKPKLRYRLSLEETATRFCSCFSEKSLIMQNC